jgi:hypothetical protein
MARFDVSGAAKIREAAAGIKKPESKTRVGGR